jgi:cytochrome c oxidase subunit 2
MNPRMSVLDPAGPQASDIASLWTVFLWVAAIVWVLVIAFMVTATLVARRQRARLGDLDPLTTDAARERRLIHGVIAAGVLTVLTLLGLLIASIVTGARLADLEDDADALHVRITGHQWWWGIDYEPDDPRATATTANELHIPVGKTVHLELVSADVIHSFWVPSLHGKKDLIPGRRNRTWLRADQPGVYRGQCAEFCGLEHAKMVITVIAEPQAEFDAWLAEQRQPARTPTTADQIRGQKVFLGGPCSMCHTVAGTPAGARLGPDLTHVASRTTLGASIVPNTTGHLTGWIIDPQAIKPGSRMPATLLPPDDLHALVAYLESLR